MIYDGFTGTMLQAAPAEARENIAANHDSFQADARRWRYWRS